ncbi:Bacterial regulatory proteins, luxR family [Cedecea neteri]|uniref:Bacterial regulatory proteins, luxR family n=1 Tax=Cedecea neteri TaxID=158822 RepID=A0A291E6C9_9ENTR|nr:LuxR C-terminal-related transcriptional regulator [Cedecea neteri]ATF95493.1 helix-turn-helix transcriptional regulator [Cedecea neteri]SQC92071.1 Bacterial regulatory proteins, luxR family [Cedecea neteri]
MSKVLPSDSGSDISLLVSMLEHLDEPWGLKLPDSRHLYMNAAALSYTLTPSNFDFEGKYDAEFPACWAELSADLIEHDRVTGLSRKKVTVIETDYWYGQGHLLPFISEKTPVFSATGELVCIVWNAKPLTSLSPLSFISKTKPGILTTEVTGQGNFTAAEHDIIFLLLQRFSIKEIARVYNLSARTIGNRVQEIYYKADVHSREQFVEYCRHTALNSYIPPSLLNKSIVFI